MKMPKIILGTLLACAPLAIAAGGPASPEREPRAPHAADKGKETSPPAANQDSSANAGAKAGAGADPAVPAEVPGKGSDPKARGGDPAVATRGGDAIPRRRAGPVTRGNTEDRLRSLLDAQASGRFARPSSPPGSTRATSGNVAARGPDGASPAVPPPVTAPNGAVGAANWVTVANPRAAANPVAAANPSASARDSTIGGPHAQGLGQIGGPATSRPAHAATVDGAQLRRKF